MKLIFGQNSTYEPKPLPEGKYRGKVVKSEWTKNKSYADDMNTEGWVLRLWVDILNKDRRIFNTIPITKALKLNKLRESAGLKPVGENDDFEASALLGKIIQVHVKVYENNEKKMVNIISQFLPSESKQVEEDDVIPEKDEDLDENTDSEGFPF